MHFRHPPQFGIATRRIKSWARNTLLPCSLAKCMEYWNQRTNIGNRDYEIHQHFGTIWTLPNLIRGPWMIQREQNLHFHFKVMTPKRCHCNEHRYALTFLERKMMRGVIQSTETCHTGCTTRTGVEHRALYSAIGRDRAQCILLNNWSNQINYSSLRHRHGFSNSRGVFNFFTG